MSKILVTGATGGLGSATIEWLLEKTSASDIVAMARDLSKLKDLEAKGIGIRSGDYTDYDSLVKAFTGIDKLYFVSGNDVENRVPQHENVARAAKAAGVSHVVYTSFERKNETASSPLAAVAEGHLKAEAAIKASGVPYTILKHNLYMEVIPLFIGEKVIEQGMIYLPAGDGKTSFMSRKDMAEVGASVLTSEGHENKYYNISSDQAYSFAEIAEMLTEISGKKINYVSPSADDFSKTLRGFGVPELVIGISLGFALGIAQEELDTTSDDPKRLTGHQPTPLKTFLTSVYGKH